MKTLHFTTTIKAPVEKVWNTMLGDATYREWAATFMPGSHYVGTWEKGSKIQFLGPDPKTGDLAGMTSKIADSKLHKFVSIKHLGLVSGGVEDTTSEEAKQWVGFETYNFRDRGEETEVAVEVETKDDFAQYMNEAWPKALAVLKEITEK